MHKYAKKMNIYALLSKRKEPKSAKKPLKRRKKTLKNGAKTVKKHAKNETVFWDGRKECTG
jgi:hypothetical protein